jgi:hypothetical protein
MFKIFSRKSRQTATAANENEQLVLDIMRMNYADDPAMQLHLDRMQTALSAQRSALSIHHAFLQKR